MRRSFRHDPFELRFRLACPADQGARVSVSVAAGERGEEVVRSRDVRIDLLQLGLELFQVAASFPDVFEQGGGVAELTEEELQQQRVPRRLRNRRPVEGTEQGASR
jgi:hypothetical protein